MIEKLLEYQRLDKQRADILHTVDRGGVKTEINNASYMLQNGRNNLLQLDNDAKGLMNAFDSTSRALKDLQDRAQKAETTQAVNEMIQKLDSVENQLENIAKAINQKNKMFEDTIATITKAQQTVGRLTPQYENQKASVAPRVREIEAEMEKIASGMDKVLLEKYRVKRSAVPMTPDGRCSGCRFELPLNMKNNVLTKGWVVCEECERIIYKG